MIPDGAWKLLNASQRCSAAGRCCTVPSVRGATSTESFALASRSDRYNSSRKRAVGPGASVTAFVYSVVPPATFKRRSKLSVQASERTERLARVVALAENLWGNESAARAFLNRPHPLLDDETPLGATRTELGARRVEQLLRDVEHGLPL